MDYHPKEILVTLRSKKAKARIFLLQGLLEILLSRFFARCGKPNSRDIFCVYLYRVSQEKLGNNSLFYRVRQGKLDKNNALNPVRGHTHQSVTERRRRKSCTCILEVVESRKKNDGGLLLKIVLHSLERGVPIFHLKASLQRRGFRGSQEKEKAVKC